MNILIVNSLYYPYRIGGAEKSVQLLAENLSAKGHSVTVATLTEGKVIKEDIINNVRVVRFPLKNIYWMLDTRKGKVAKILWHLFDIYNIMMYLQVKSFFKEDRFDVVHTNNLCGFSIALWSWAKQRKIPITHTARDYYLLHPNTTLFNGYENISPKNKSALFFSYIKKKLSRHVSGFVSISDFVNDVHIHNGYFKNAKKYTIYNSIGKPAIKPLEHTFSGRIRFGYLGRVEESKGIAVLLQEFNNLNNEEDFSLMIAGDGDSEYINVLHSTYPRSKSNIFFVGKVNIDDFFPNIDFLIVPSLWNEPMGRVVIESYSFGKPVIGSTRGGITEIIRDNETGYLFEPDIQGSLNTIMQKIRKMNSKEYEQMSRCALKYASQFDSLTMVDSYINSYLEVGKTY